MQSTEFAAFYAALRSSAQNRVTVLPPAALVALAPIGTGYIRTTDGSWWMKLAPGNVLTQIAPASGGGSADFPSPYVIWVSATAPAGGDGKIGTPFQTIQEGVDAVAALASAVLMIAPGQYADPIVFNGSGRRIALCAMGAVEIQNNITWTVDAPSASPSALWLGAVGDDSSEVYDLTLTSGLYILGNIIAIAPAGPPLTAGVIGGTFFLGGDLDGSGYNHSLQIVPSRARITGVCNVPRGSLVASGTTFVGLVTVDNFFRVHGCDFQTGMTVTTAAAPGYVDPAGLFCCAFAGTFTGPANSGRMDGSTYKSFLDNSLGFAGGATLVLLEEGLAEQTEYDPAVPGNWLAPVPNDVAEALDQLAERVTDGIPLQLLPAFWHVPNPRLWTVGSALGSDFPDMATAIASPTVLDGDTLSLAAETFTVAAMITVNKRLIIVGAGMGNTILQTPGAAGDPVTVISITASGVRLSDMTVRQRKTTNTSLETAITINNPAGDSDRIQRVAMESMEFCILARTGQFLVDSCDLRYVGPAGNTHRLIGVYGNWTGDSVISNNTFWPSADAAPGRTVFCLLSQNMGDPNFVGSVTIQNNTQMGAGNLRQFCLQESFNGAPNSFDVTVKGNSFNALSLDIGVYGASAAFYALFRSVTITGNSSSNIHGKGLYAIDGVAPATLGASPDIYFNGNVVANPTISNPAYSSALVPDQGLFGYNTATFGTHP